MSLARALTVIRSRKSSDAVSARPTKSLTLKRSYAAGTLRPKISGPMELISTTNMISYNAPDISPSTIASSSVSDLDISPTESRSSFTSIECSSEELSVQPNHLSCYFGSPASCDKAPSIPRRAPSHIKSNDCVETFLARKQSQNYTNPSRRNIKSMARSSLLMFSPEIEILDHLVSEQEEPDIHEIEQSQKISYTPNILESEDSETITQGFFRFGAEEYISEIDEIYRFIFGVDSNTLSKKRW